MRYILLSFLCLMTSLSALQAQQVRVFGRVADAQSKNPIDYATVFWLSLTDGSQAGGSTDSLGRFSLDVDISQGRKGSVTASFLGYNERTIPVEIPEGVSEYRLGLIELFYDSTSLEEVQIVEQVLPAIQKDDTTQFNANAFKVNPDATAEDLMRKLPGAMDNNGKLQVQGEDVKQVLVDGKPFFGSDPNAALKNLPADAIDKIQVYDQQSMGGFGDGNTTKTINIITKPTMRDGLFGRVLGGFGYDMPEKAAFTDFGSDYRYKTAANINYFKGDRRLSIMAQSNNINEQNFSTEDLLGVVSVNQNASGGRGGGGGRPGGGGGGRPGGGRPGGGGGDVSDFLVNDRNGISTTHAFGLNYMDKLGKKKQFDLSTSYFFNWSGNNALTSTYRQFIQASDSGQVYNEATNSRSRNMNQRLNLQLSWRIDSLNTLMIRPRVTLQYNNGMSNTAGSYATREANLSSNTSDFGSKLWGVNVNNEIYYTHLFPSKKGRMLTASVTNTYNLNTGNNNLISANIYPVDTLFVTDSIRQQAGLLKKSWSVNGNVTHTEPISQKSALQFSYTGSYTNNDSDKKTHAYETATDSYSRLDSTLSNVFRSGYHTQGAGMSYRYQHKDLTVSFTGSYQWSLLDNLQQFPQSNVIRRMFHAFVPSMMVRHNITKTKSWRLFYRTSTTPPSIDQLQNVMNNNNPLQLSSGNPDLNQSFDQRLFTRYSSTNTDKNSSFFAMIGGTFTHNYVGNSTLIAARDTVVNGVFLPVGGQWTRPENFKEGMLWLRTFVTYSIPIKKIKTNFSVNASCNYSRTPGRINGDLNLAHSPVLGLGVSFTSNISENIDFSLSSNSNLSFVANSLQTSSNTRFFTQTTNFRLNWIFWKGFLIQTEVNHLLNTGLSASFNTNFVLWNVSIGKKFLKNNAAEFRLTVFDLLNQNTQVQRTTTETYIQDQRNTILQRYVMLTFTYNIKHFKEKDPNGQPTPGH